MRTFHFMAKISLFLTMSFLLSTFLPAYTVVSEQRASEDGSATREGANDQVGEKADNVFYRETGGRRGWIGGRYYVSRRVNVAGASVKLDHESGNDVYLTVTDEKGKWNFRDISEGEYDIEIFKEGFEQSGKSDVILQFPFKSVIELKAIPSAKAYGSVMQWSITAKTAHGSAGDASDSEQTTVTIKGSVISQNGEPLSGAQFILKDINGRIDPYRGYTDKAGSCIIEKITTGLYDLSISSMTYFPLRLVLDVHREVDLRVIMVPQPQDYRYTPSDLIPPEEPLPPAFLLSLP